MNCGSSAGKAREDELTIKEALRLSNKEKKQLSELLIDII
jgi:hypothetical protein